MGEDFSRQTRISNAVWAENLPLRHARGDSKQVLNQGSLSRNDS